MESPSPVSKKSHKRKAAEMGDNNDIADIEHGYSEDESRKKMKAKSWKCTSEMKKAEVKKAETKATMRSSGAKMVDMTKIPEEDDEDEDEPPKQIIAHIFIESSSPPPLSGKSQTKNAMSTKVLQRGPCFLNVNDDFESLLKSLAKVAPCAVKSLVVSKLQWKFEDPMSGARKLLSNVNGYNAMISAVKTKMKKADAVVFVYMLPPVKPEEVYFCFDSNFYNF